MPRDTILPTCDSAECNALMAAHRLLERALAISPVPFVSERRQLLDYAIRSQRTASVLLEQATWGMSFPALAEGRHHMRQALRGMTEIADELNSGVKKEAAP